MASAGESLAAGVIFTRTCHACHRDMGRYWNEFPTLAIALLGGLLGTMFTIALRRLFIVEEDTCHTQKVSPAEKYWLRVRKVEAGALAVEVYALGIGALYGLMVKGFKVTHHSAETAF